MSRSRKNVTQTSGHLPKLNGARQDDLGVSPTQAGAVLVDYNFILTLVSVIGGCCANVGAYEQLLKMNPRIGSALTFSQMAFIAAWQLPSFIHFPSAWYLPHLKPRQVPLHQWLLQVLVLTSGSLLNNWAFAFQVPLTVQIVFRSSGLAISMLFGRLFLNRRYSFVQIISVCLVSVGVILATLSRPSGSATNLTRTPAQSADDVKKYTLGVGMLVVSLFLTGFLGLLQERTYQRYGPCWKEGVFYTHFLSLPIFLFLIPDVKQGIANISKNTPGLSLTSSYVILLGNLLSQLICVSGVNRLSSQVSSVSTNLVLTTRKALSLCLSVWWFGNGWNVQLGLGAGMVFLGSLIFSTGSKGKGSKKD